MPAGDGARAAGRGARAAVDPAEHGSHPALRRGL